MCSVAQDTAIFIGIVTAATNSLGSGTMNSMKKNGNHSTRSARRRA
jgi:hypothetical protein